jgi:uncharacterized protein (DUF1778 family)
VAQPSGKLVASSPPSATPRNTARAVVPIRLSDAERAQIAAAAGHLELTLSGFLRQSALQASAIVEGKASVKPPDVSPSEPVREAPVVLLDASPRHAFVDGICKRCHRDEDERSSPCLREAA